MGNRADIYIIWAIELKIMRWAGHLACMGERRNVYRVLVGKLEGKRLLGRPRRRCEDNIKMYVFFWVIPRRLNFICRRFGTLCSVFIGR
jgi:hypothetical protein